MYKLKAYGVKLKELFMYIPVGYGVFVYVGLYFMVQH
jgi:hypothetical protein